MGSIIQNAANNIGANGVFSSSALNNASLSGITALPTGVGGKLKLISTQTASGSASIEFTSGIDSTYDVYYFEFIDIHSSGDNVSLQFNLSTDSGSNYNVTKTTTFFQAQHSEDDVTSELNYETASDLAQSTGYQQLARSFGSDNDQAGVGFLQLFNPSSTTFVKHFISNFNSYKHNDRNENSYVAGYGNTTSAINAISFQMSSGNIDAGTIKMYGISA